MNHHRHFLSPLLSLNGWARRWPSVIGHCLIDTLVTPSFLMAPPSYPPRSILPFHWLDDGYVLGVRFHVVIVIDSFVLCCYCSWCCSEIPRGFSRDSREILERFLEGDPRGSEAMTGFEILEDSFKNSLRIL